MWTPKAWLQLAATTMCARATSPLLCFSNLSILIAGLATTLVLYLPLACTGHSRAEQELTFRTQAVAEITTSCCLQWLCKLHRSTRQHQHGLNAGWNERRSCAAGLPGYSD